MNQTWAIIWDLEGTLSDTHSLCRECMSRVLSLNGYTDPSPSLYSLYSQYSAPQRLALHACKDEDDPVGPALAKQYEDLVVRSIDKTNTSLFDGMKYTLRELYESPHVRMGVLSNSSYHIVHTILTEHGIDDLFMTYNGSDSVPACKPNPEGLRHTLRQLDAEPMHAVHVGDSPVDGDTAKAAGVHSIGVTWGFYSESELEGHFDEVVHSSADLLSALRRIINHTQIKPSASVPPAILKHESCESSGSGCRKERRVSWDKGVVDNENMNKLRTDNEYWYN